MASLPASNMTIPPKPRRWSTYHDDNDDDHSSSTARMAPTPQHSNLSQACLRGRTPERGLMGTTASSNNTIIRIEPPETNLADEPISWSSLFDHLDDSTSLEKSFSSPSSSFACLRTHLGGTTDVMIRIEMPETSTDNNRPVSWSSLFNLLQNTN